MCKFKIISNKIQTRNRHMQVQQQVFHKKMLNLIKLYSEQFKYYWIRSYKLEQFQLYYSIFSESSMFQNYMRQGQKVLPAENGLGQVWISGYQFARSIPQLQKNKIKAVCSCGDFGLTYAGDIAHLTLDLKDEKTQQIQHFFHTIFYFIQQNRKKHNVLVHCAGGISRSSTMLIYYMMEKYDKNYDTCLKNIRQVRPCCKPNIGFEKMLRKYQKKIGIQQFSD